jgi:lipoprotein-anchoring transpeptidase ErfK/SrfK
MTAAARAAAISLVVVALAGCGEKERAAAPARPARPPAEQQPGRVVPPVVPALSPGQTIVASVRRRSELRAAPGGRVIATIPRLTEFASPQVLAVLGVKRGWARVLHPDVPDGRGAWVSLKDVRLRPAAWAIDVDLSERRGVLRRNGRPFSTFVVGVGSPLHPTPTGRFGVTDRLQATRETAYYGCCVLALTGHQPHIAQQWRGGDRLAIHGTDRPSTIGQAATLGCLHTDEKTMRMLMARVPLGTVVTIRD